MRYDDASQTGSTEHSQPVARPDEDRLPAGSFGPATGNAITGAGTTSGASGEDHVGAGATITAVQGAGGQTVATNGAYQASGQYGLLSMDMQGNFSYVRNPGTPDGVKDVFNYTLADASGANSSTTLTIDIGQVAAAAAGQGIVNLPQGVELSDIHVNGRDLVINMPDGTQMVIPGGAVFVPQLVIGDVQVPPTNLAALLVDNEPQPAAGPPTSSGGNFADPVPPLDPGVPLGDLIPPTELHYTPPEFKNIGQFEDKHPTVVIEPHDLAPGAIDALDQVNEAGLPAPRDGDSANETPGTGEIADGIGDNNSNDSENTFGQIVFTAGDGANTITVDGVTITGASVGTTIQGQFGIMTITSVNIAGGTIGYTYALSDNTSGDNTADHFTVVITDADGDTATATLTIDIIDDTPIARPDTDAIVKGADTTDGNVLTGDGTTSGAAGADTPGADNLVNNGDGVTGIHAGSGAGTFDAVTGGGTLVHGTFGDLVIHADGSYTYTLTATNGTPGGNDVFTYQITDGDGDTSTATLTISVPADSVPVAIDANAVVDDDNLPGGNHDLPVPSPGDDNPSPNPDAAGTTVSGTLTANFGGDAPGSFGFSSDMDGKVATIGQETVTYHVVAGVLTAEVTDSPDAGREGSSLFTVTIAADGSYSVHLLENVLQVNDGTNTENNASATINFSVTDGDGDTSVQPGHLNISFDDDIPTAIVPPPGEGGGPPTPLVTGLVDEDALATGNNDSAPGDDPGGASASGLAGSLGALFNAGADQPLSFSLSTVTSGLPSLTSNGHAVTYAVAGNVLTASADLNGDGHIGAGETIFTLTVNSNGSWTFDLQGQLDHPTGAGTASDNTEDPNLLLDLSSIVVATDSDGDSATGAAGAFVINVDDDMPAQVEGSVTAHVDEDELPNGITDGDGQTTVASGSLASQVSVGADQPGTFSLDASALGGLPALTSGGAAVHYAIVGGELVAFTGNDSSTNHVFTVSLDSSGNYTVTLDAPIDHLPNSPANDDNQNLTLDLSGLVQVTDADGDSIHLDARSFLVQIEDDIPAATNTQLSGSVDEDGIVGNASDGGDGNGIAGGPGDIAGESTVATGNVSGLFLSGADTPLTYSLSNTFTALQAEGLTSKGVALTYNVSFDANTHIYTLTATAGANTVFTFTVDANTGAYQFNLIDQLDHPTLNGLTGDNTENNLAIQLGSIIQATDADGDTVTANSGANSGLVINVNDDTPVARNDTDEILAGGSTATGNVITGVGTTSGAAGHDSTGADAPISVVQIQGTGGTDTTFSSGVLSIAGDHGTLEIHANGDYTYTRTDNVGGVSDTFTYTIQDADGDTTTATLTIGIEDSIPTLATPDVAHLDDDAVAGANGNLGGTGDDLPNPPSPDTASGTLVGSGGDGTLTYHFSANADQTGLPTGFSVNTALTTGTTMVIDQLQNGVEVHVFSISLNTATGDYTVTQTAAVMHPSLDGQAGDNTENNISDINVSFFVQDADGDHSNTVNLNINVDDDTPTINVTKGDDSAISLTTDDADTIGVNTDHSTTTTANFGGVFGLSFSAGADGTNTTPTLAFALGVSSQGVLSGLSSHGSAIHLYLLANGEVVGSTAASAPASDSDASVVFSVTVNGTGQVTLNQMQQIDHPLQAGANDAPFNDQSVSLADNLITLTASSSITDKDGDTATGSQSVNIGANLHFTDDGPTASTSGTAIGTVTLDETRPEGSDTASGGAPSGDASNTINFSANFVTGASVNFGADGPGTVGYSLHISGANVGSGLFALDNTVANGKGGEIVLNQSGNTITGSFGGVNYFTISIDPSTGIATFTELHNIWNPTAGSSAAALDDLALLHTAAASDIQVVQTVTDFDGDTATAHINVGQDVFGIQDDGPRFGNVDTTLQIDNSGTISGTGDMQITIGTDSPNGDSGNQNPDDIAVSNFGIQVNGTDAQNVTLTPGAENATTASYTFSFDYDTGTGGTDHETGTLVFNKAAGTYTVTLDHPIQSFSILQTANGSAGDFVNWNPNNTTSNSPSHIANVHLQDNFFVQFTGESAGSGTTQGTNGSFDPVTTATFSGLELFKGTDATVTLSSSAAGVAGNTLQGGEVLDFNLYSTDPQGTLGIVPTQNTTSMFIELDGVGTTEDMIVVLKLYDTVTHQYTTEALMVQNGDIIKSNATLAGTAYSGIVLDNNDGLVVIEANDYQNGNTNLVIVGAQIAGSDDGVTGTAINFNGALGAAGGSSGTQPFTTDVNDNPFKIQNIGFLTQNSQDQNATISFDTTIHDADGDTATTHVDVTIGTPPAPIQPLAVQQTQMVSQTSLNTSSLVSSNDNNEQRTSNAAHNAALMGAVAAAGLDSLHGLQSEHASVSGVEHSSALAPTIDTLVASSASAGSSHADSAHTVQPTLAAGTSGHSAPQGGGTVHDMVETAHSLTPANAQSAAPTDLPHGSEGPAHAAAAASAVTAAAVVMPSAAQLAAAASHGVAQADNSVAGNTPQHEQVVSKVLVDALHGGGGGVNIDGLLNNVSSHAAAQDALQALASHGAGVVSFGHTAFADAFGSAHGMQMMHPDIAPPVHG